MKWTKSEIEEYKNKSLQAFRGRSGNLPYDRYIDKYGFTSFYIPNEDERFALTSEPLSFCYDLVEPDRDFEIWKDSLGLVFASKGDDCVICPSDILAPILGIQIESSITGELFQIPISEFITPLKNTIECKCDVYPHGDINEYLLSVIRETKPYVTIRELFDELLTYIGNKEFYFKSETYTKWHYGPQHPELRSCYLVKKKSK